MVAITLILSMMIPTIVCTAETGDNGISAEEEEIQLLLDERAEVLSRIFFEDVHGGDVQSYNANLYELNEKDLELTRLGVSFLTQEEVNEQFKGTEDLTLFDQTQVGVGGGNVQPMAEVPYGSCNTWLSYRSTHTVNGTTYNVQKLVAHPQDPASPLADADTRIVYLSRNWKAASLNFLSFLASEYVGGITNQIPGASIVLSLFDCLGSIVSGLHDDMEVNAAHIAYSWSLVTTASFTYVKLEGYSDDYQLLSLVSTKVQAAVGYQLPSFYYIDYNGQRILAPELIQSQHSITVIPTDYDSTSLAIASYNSGPIALQRCVKKVTISGAEGQRIVEVNTICPSFPIHCER